MCTVVKSSFRYVCVMTYLCAWHDSSVRGTRLMYSILQNRRLPACGSWLIHLCDMTHTYFRADGSGDVCVCYDTHIPCVCVSWHTHTECVITCVFGGYDTFICVHSYVYIHMCYIHDSFLLHTWYIHMCYIHDSFFRRAYLIYMCNRKKEDESHMSHVWIRHAKSNTHESVMCVTYLWKNQSPPQKESLMSRIWMRYALQQNFMYVTFICVMSPTCPTYEWVMSYDKKILGRTSLICVTCRSHHERWGAGVETPKNIQGEIGGWGRVPFNEPYAPSLSTIYDGA